MLRVVWQRAVVVRDLVYFCVWLFCFVLYICVKGVLKTHLVESVNTSKIQTFLRDLLHTHCLVLSYCREAGINLQLHNNEQQVGESQCFSCGTHNRHFIHMK